MIDTPTIVLGVIALVAIVLLAIATPSVIRDHREWKRRQRMTPYERAMEDFKTAVEGLKTAFVTMLIPVVENTTAVFQGLADALKVDTSVTKEYSHSRADVPLESE